MPRIESSQRFKGDYRDLPPEIQLMYKNELRLVVENIRHPSLQTKPIHGVAGIYEARIDQRFRIMCEGPPGTVVRMRTVGKHDESLRNP
jgi:mRNA-degrading endonuclease RelE of RelBE toxin-antitoxin system